MSKPIILCNLCGLPCNLQGNHCDTDDYGGLVEYSIRGNFDSTPGNGNGALDNMAQYTFSMCEFCLDWLFSQFKILPKVEYYQGFLAGWKETEKFRSAKERVENDDWRQFKNEFFVEFEKRNRARNERLR